MRYLFMYGIVMYLVIAILSTGCSTPETTMNFFTPDRFGYGVIQGTSTWKGQGDLTTYWNSDIGDVYWDIKGESESSILYLEWDIPQWTEEHSAYDRYVRERQELRRAMLEAEIKEIQDEG